MREPPRIIKAINALNRASFDDPIHHVPYITEKAALELVELGYASRTPWSKDANVFCYRVTDAGRAALKAKADSKRSLPRLQPRIGTLPPRIKS